MSRTLRSAMSSGCSAANSDTTLGLDELAAWFGVTALDTVMALSGRLTAHYRDAAGGAAAWSPLPREA